MDMERVLEQCERLRQDLAKKQEEVEKVSHREREALNRVRELNDQVASIKEEQEQRNRRTDVLLFQREEQVKAVTAQAQEKYEKLSAERDSEVGMLNERLRVIRQTSMG